MRVLFEERCLRVEEQVISLSEILEALRKRWLLIAVITILCTGIAATLSIFVIEPVYETSTKLFIGKEQNSVEGYNNDDIFMYQKLLKTYSEAIKTKDLVNRAVSKTSFNLTSSEILENLNVTT